MPKGYDNRTVQRDSFAFQPPAPVQTQAGPSGQSRQPQIVGGDSIGGAIPAGPQSDPGILAPGLGRYFGELMQPYVEREQRRKFFEGYSDAQSGIALKELTDNGNPLTKLFGPTGYAQGAQFYTAKTRLSEWSQAQLADMDRLKRLTPSELASEMAQASDDILTDDPFVNDMLQQGILEQSGPLLNTIAKERFAWQQTEVVNAMTTASAASATTLQQLLSAQAKLGGEPDDASKTAINQALSTFLGGMAKPEGMEDDSYRKYLTSFMKGAMQDGNFYAVSAMRKAGVMSVLSEEDQIKLDDAYTKYGNKVLGKAAMDHVEELIALDATTKSEDGDLSAMEAANALATINQKIKMETGLEELDLFDYEDIRQYAGRVGDILIAKAQRLQDRQWQLEDRAAAQAFELERDAAEDAQVAAQVQTLWGMGQVGSGIAAGLSRSDFEILAAQDYETGNLNRLARAYGTDGFVSSVVADRMQAKITASLGDTYTKDSAAAYEEWKALNKLRPSAAQAYYGKYHSAFQRFDSLVRGGSSPNLAYVKAFGDPEIYGDYDIPASRRKEVREDVASYVDSLGPRWYNPATWGEYSLNASGRSAVADAISRQVSIASKNSSLPTKVLVADAIEFARKNNSLESYGPFAWVQKAGTTPLHREFGLQPKDTAVILTAMINRDLQRAGFPDGAYGQNYDILRGRDDQGKPFFLVAAKDANNAANNREIVLTWHRMKLSIDAYVKELRKPNPTRTTPAQRKKMGREFGSL